MEEPFRDPKEIYRESLASIPVNVETEPPVIRRAEVWPYPDLARLHEDLNVNHLWRNLAVRCGEFLRRGSARLLGNRVWSDGAAFPEDAGGALEFEGAVVESEGFRPIPFGDIGLYRDDYRRELPERLIAELRAGR